MPVQARGEQQAGLACSYLRTGLEVQERFRGAGRGAGRSQCLQGRGKTPQVSSATGERERAELPPPPRRVLFKACFPTTFKWHLP